MKKNLLANHHFCPKPTTNLKILIDSSENLRGYVKISSAQDSGLIKEIGLSRWLSGSQKILAGLMWRFCGSDRQEIRKNLENIAVSSAMAYRLILHYPPHLAPLGASWRHLGNPQEVATVNQISS
jgi:hypothetical protein